MLGLSLGLGLTPRHGLPDLPPGSEYVTYGGDVVTYNGQPVWVRVA